MPTKESERVDAHRKKNFDRISVLVDKGGKELYRVLALREDISVTEMIRRAVLARAGLKALPYPDDLAELEKVETYKHAWQSIRRLQLKEEADEIYANLIDELSTEPSEAVFTTKLNHADIAEFREAVTKIEAAIEEAGADDSVFSPPVTLKLKGREIGILRRLLSNIEPQDIDIPAK